MQFMIRIELHNAKDESIYERLHVQAARENLSRTLTDADTGDKSRALTGIYWTESYSKWQEVMAAAKRAASAVHPDFGVMVADGTIHYYKCPPMPAPRLLAPRRLPSVFDNFSSSTVPVPLGLPTLANLGHTLTPTTSTIPVSGSLPPLSGLELLYEAMLKTK